MEGSVKKQEGGCVMTIMMEDVYSFLGDTIRRYVMLSVKSSTIILCRLSVLPCKFAVEAGYNNFELFGICLFNADFFINNDPESPIDRIAAASTPSRAGGTIVLRRC